MNGTFKKIWNAFTTVLITIVVVIAFLLAGMRLIGYNVFTVLSGSMEPAIHTGSVVYVKESDVEDIKVGDVITYMLDEDTISTHRVVGIVEGEPQDNNPTGIKFRLKGDANASEDGSPTMYSNVIGEVKFTIPYMGYIAEFIKNPPGTYVAIAGGIILLILIFLPDILSDDKGKAKKGGKTAEASSKEDHENDPPSAPEEEKKDGE